MEKGDWMSASDWAGLKEMIKEYAGSTGIDKIGFTDVQPLTEHLPRLYRRKNANYRYAIREGDPQKRIDPRLHMPEAKSVISVAIAYPWQETVPSRESGPEPEPAKGRVSFVARGTDYHVVVGAKLAGLREFILSLVPTARLMVMVDKAEILEKALAVRAGLGWFGKNTLLVTPEYGSWVYLGELVTDLPFPPDQPLARDCGHCRKCLDSCPAGALDEEKNLNPDRCLAGITLSRLLPDRELRDLMGNTLYGCDLCQLVCPYNQEAGRTEHEEFRPQGEEDFPVLADLFKMTNSGFIRRFGHTSAAWRGKTTIQRNAVIAAGNLKDNGSVPALIRIVASDSRPAMRRAAAWALGKISSPEGLQALRAALDHEPDPEVIEEIRYGLIL